MTPASSPDAAVKTFMIEPGTYRPLTRSAEERLGGIVAQRVHRRLRGVRVAGDRRRVERGGGDERKHGAADRVDRHDRAGVSAELGGGEVLEALVDGQRQVPGDGLALEDVVDDVADRVRIGLPDQDVLEGALDPGAAEAEARVPDDVGEGRIVVGPPAEPVDDLGAGEELSPAVPDAPWRGRLRRAAMTSGLSARAARFGASRTCHHTMLSDTIAKLSIRYKPSRRTLVAITRGVRVRADRAAVADREQQPDHDEARQRRSIRRSSRTAA